MVFLNTFLCHANRASGSKGGIKGETLDDEENSDEGDEEDYTVYECHGLAPVSYQLAVLAVGAKNIEIKEETQGSDNNLNISGLSKL